MRRALLAAVVMGLVACGGEAPAPVAPPAPTTPPVATNTAPPVDPTPAKPPKRPLAELQREAGKTYADGMTSGDAKKVASIFTQDAVFKMAGTPDMSGKDNVEKGVDGLFKSFSKIKIGEQRVFVKNEVVVSEFTMTATHSGDFAGAKASEKPVGWVGASVAWFNDDGLIKEYHLYWNPAVVMFQIGATKDKNRGVPALPGSPEVVIAKGGEDTSASDTLKQINTAWEKKDDAAFGKLLADNVEWDDITMPEPNKGKAAVQKYFKTLNAGFSDIKVATTNEWVFGEYVVEEGTFSGTNTGPLFGAPATKKPATIHELSVLKVDKDKKVVKAVTYGNDMELMMQLNPPKPKPEAKPAADKPAPKPADKPATPAAPKK